MGDAAYEAGRPRAGVWGGSGRTGCPAPNDSATDSSDEGGEGEEADEEKGRTTRRRVGRQAWHCQKRVAEP